MKGKKTLENPYIINGGICMDNCLGGCSLWRDYACVSE